VPTPGVTAWNAWRSPVTFCLKFIRSQCPGSQLPIARAVFRVNRTARKLSAKIMAGYDINDLLRDEIQLEFLLALDSRIHHLKDGDIEATRVTATDRRPHGLSYSFTFNAPDGRRLIGFDNTHRGPAAGSRFKRRPPSNDHWHRTENDRGRPYLFRDAETLIDDSFREVEQVLGEHGIAPNVIEVEETRRWE
jgi:hypothetical protein